MKIITNVKIHTLKFQFSNHILKLRPKENSYSIQFFASLYCALCLN